MGNKKGKQIHPKVAEILHKNRSRAVRMTDAQEPKREKEEREKEEKKIKEEECKVIAKYGFKGTRRCRFCGTWVEKGKDHINCHQIIRDREREQANKERNNKNAGCISSGSKT